MFYNYSVSHTHAKSLPTLSLYPMEHWVSLSL